MNPANHFYTDTDGASGYKYDVAIRTSGTRSARQQLGPREA